MKFTICKLIPKGPLHIGMKEVGQNEVCEFIHSDTLFSALCNCLRMLYGKDELEKFIAIFLNDKPPFLISSAFPFVEDTLLFPIPKNFSEKPEFKELKKIEFISFEIFEKYINGEDISEWLKKDNLIADKRILLTHKREIPVWKVFSEIPHASIDRGTNVSNIFYSSEVFYSTNCGLYFLIDYKTDEYKDKIKEVINLLAFQGIGGERSYGKGFFNLPEFGEIEINLPYNYKHFTTLSLYYPRKDEVVSLKDGWYEFIKRGGWIYSPDCQTLRKKSVRMVVEGSVLREMDNKGEIKDVTPENFTAHKVYRYGLAFKIPIKV